MPNEHMGTNGQFAATGLPHIWLLKAMGKEEALVCGNDGDEGDEDEDEDEDEDDDEEEEEGEEEGEEAAGPAAAVA